MVSINVEKLKECSEALEKKLNLLDDDMANLSLKLDSIESYWTSEDYQLFFNHIYNITSTFSPFVDSLNLYADSLSKLVDTLDSI